LCFFGLCLCRAVSELNGHLKSFLQLHFLLSLTSEDLRRTVRVLLYKIPCFLIFPPLSPDQCCQGCLRFFPDLFPRELIHAVPFCPSASEFCLSGPPSLTTRTYGKLRCVFFLLAFLRSDRSVPHFPLMVFFTWGFRFLCTFQPWLRVFQRGRFRFFLSK